MNMEYKAKLINPTSGQEIDEVLISYETTTKGRIKVDLKYFQLGGSAPFRPYAVREKMLPTYNENDEVVGESLQQTNVYLPTIILIEELGDYTGEQGRNEAIEAEIKKHLDRIL